SQLPLVPTVYRDDLPVRARSTDPLTEIVSGIADTLYNPVRSPTVGSIVLDALGRFLGAEDPREVDYRRRLELMRELARFEEKRSEADINKAIAYAIRNGSTVRIEEKYRASGKGSAGVTAKQNSVKVGIDASGKQLVKRTITISAAGGTKKHTKTKAKNR